MLKPDRKIRLDSKPGEIKSKYFVVVLSSERNLQLCRINSIAGFPETNNGQWAFLDIDIGNYLSFYFNGRIWDLYEVTSKTIPEEWHTKLALGQDRMDPIVLSDGEKWDAIGSGNKFIYFPFRLRLKKIRDTSYDTNIVFKPGFERLGINLIPRVGLRKTHFQLSTKDVVRFFDIQQTMEGRDLDLSSFVMCKRRSQHRVSKGRIPIGFEKGTVDEATHQEIYLQALLKKLLEAYVEDLDFGKYGGEFEFLSEQTVDGGESDIVVICKSNETSEFYIELKNAPMVSKGQLTTKGKEAQSQVTRYSNLINRKLTMRGIGGKNKNSDNCITVYKKDDLMILEVDAQTSLSLLC